VRRWFLISLLLFIGAVIFLGSSIATGEGQLGVFLIFPFIFASGLLAATGVILLFGAIITLFIGSATSIEQVQPDFRFSIGPKQEPTTIEKRYGGVVMLGPIPIAFGSDKKIARKMMIIGFVLFLAIFVIILVLLSGII